MPKERLRVGLSRDKRVFSRLARGPGKLPFHFSRIPVEKGNAIELHVEEWSIEMAGKHLRIACLCFGPTIQVHIVEHQISIFHTRCRIEANAFEALCERLFMQNL